ncbi:hypothetical protein [Ruegeria atlantica]|uniref:Helix-turn-helix domain protein n=1 Tax=Ruegeria atlantica TaxID=81569 RepID=A0A0P1ESU0_9RHOB|nr:hypothetical protein [Ruegeria atlantica]CUH45107.1 Helix-turn-helix domain protein [Ruegeria atlantica]
MDEEWYQRLMAYRGEAFEPIHDRLQHMVAQHFRGTYSVGKPRDRTWISATEASRILGVRTERVVAAVASGVLAGRQSSSGYGHKHTMVQRDEVEDLIATRRNYLSAKDAMSFLGVGKSQFQLIQEAGMIARDDSGTLPVFADGPFDLRKLKIRLGEIRSMSQEKPRGDMVAFREINLRRTTDRSALLSFYKHVFEGAITPAYANQHGTLGDFLFAEDDINRALRPSSMAIEWSAHQVAEITGWKAEVVVHWCRKGLLKSNSSPHASKEKFMVSPESLSAFQREFVPLADLARQKGTSGKALRARLQAAGLVMLGEKKVGATSRGSLVRIAELATLQ